MKANKRQLGRMRNKEKYHNKIFTRNVKENSSILYKRTEKKKKHNNKNPNRSTQGTKCLKLANMLFFKE